MMKKDVDILLQALAGGLKPTLDEMKQRISALEVENKVLRGMLTARIPQRPHRPARRA